MSHGFSTISTLKALLSFEQEDLANAIESVLSTSSLMYATYSVSKMLPIYHTPM